MEAGGGDQNGLYQPAAAAAATATATAARRADPLHSIPLRTGGPLLGSRGLRGKSWGPSARTGASPAAQHCRQSRRRTGSHAGCCNSRGPAPSRRRPPRAPSARLAVGRCRGPDGGGDGERERGAAQPAGALAVGLAGRRASSTVTARARGDLHAAEQADICRCCL